MYEFNLFHLYLFSDVVNKKHASEHVYVLQIMYLYKYKCINRHLLHFYSQFFFFFNFQFG